MLKAHVQGVELRGGGDPEEVSFVDRWREITMDAEENKDKGHEYFTRWWYDSLAFLFSP